MRKLRNRKWIFGFLVLALTASMFALDFYQEKQEKNHKAKVRSLLRNKINNSLATSSKDLPKKIELDDQTYSINYSLDENLTKYIRRLLRRHRPDFSSVVVIDNNTGEILSAVGYRRDTKSFDDNLAFTSTHPSASLFKIVTAASLLNDSEVSKKTKFSYRGRGTTLYKYQLNNKKSRWMRTQSFKKAFAFSNNVVFGKAAIQNLKYGDLYDMASRFGFNQSLMDEINLSKSIFSPAKSEYHLAELASGFNKQTFISPIHGAVLASIVSNDGVLKYPKLVKSVVATDENYVWKNNRAESKVIDDELTERLQDLMEYTVKRGTARRISRGLPYKYRKGLDIGAKTGSITGGVPFGKRDWISAYAKPKDSSNDKGISICVMNVNREKWYVKSTYLTKKVINYYYKKVKPLNKKVYLSMNSKTQR